MRRLLYVHPAMRSYRETLFRMLGEQGFHFLFTTSDSLGSHAAKETTEILSRFPYPAYQARELRWLPLSDISFDLLRIFRYDVIIFSHTQMPFLLCAWLAKRLGKKVLLFDVMWHYPQQVRRFRAAIPLIRRLVTRHVDAIIAAGTKCAEMYVELFGADRSKIFTAPETTIDLLNSPRDEATAERIKTRVCAEAGNRRVVLYLGRLVEYKGLDVLIRAMSRLPDDTCLLVVGTGPFEETCRQLTHDLNLQDRVRFLGGCSADESRYYYEQAELFVLPARFMEQSSINCEAWGFTVNEAMSLEIPVVATTAVGAAWDLIRDGETGMMAKENDWEDLAAKLNFLLADEERRLVIGQQGRQWLMQRCSYEQSFQAYQDALAFALNRVRKTH